MPDTYTSQFSGEEIDSSLRAAQLISGASTPAELRNKLEIRGDTIPVSATDPTPVSEALTASGGGVNPNLLDNWFFGRPVNQRGGMMVPPGTTYLTSPGGATGGVTDKYYPAKVYDSGSYVFTKDGASCYVGNDYVVPGYCAAGYTVDRWKFSNNNGKIVLDDTGIMFTGMYDYAELNQLYEFPENLREKQYTASILIDSFDGEGNFFLVVQNQNVWASMQLSKGLNHFTDTFWSDSTTLRFFIQSQSVNLSNPPKIHILAAKLELGSQQTLAHKENGVWVLNEVPDYGEQLRRCQRYCRVIGGTLNQVFCIAVRRETTVLEGFIPIDNPFRTAPSISVNGYFSVIPDFHGVKFISSDTLSPQGVSLFFERQDGGTFDKDAYLIYAGADTRITLSADL